MTSEPKDLGIKIENKEKVAWKNIRDGAEKELEQTRRAILISEVVIALAKEKIKEYR